MLYPPDPRLHVTLARDRGERVAADIQAARGAGPGLAPPIGCAPSPLRSGAPGAGALCSGAGAPRLPLSLR